MACVSLQIAPVTVSSWSVYQARFAAHWALVLITLEAGKVPNYVFRK